MASSDEHDPIQNPTHRTRSIVKEEKTEDGGDYCRICRGEGTPEQPLYYPCKCSGSIKFVHQDCLMEWLSHSQKKYCELCKTPFRFTKLYDQSMPENVPWPLFARQMLLHTFRSLAKWLRYSFAISIWLCWLPWTIRQIWRGLFWIADGSWLSTQEMRAAVEAVASHVSNDSSVPALPVISFNTTVENPAGTAASVLLPTLSALLGLLDPKIFLRGVLRVLVSFAIHPNVLTEPLNWSSGAFLFAHISRPPSLLSDFESIASATRFKILNNALLDVLEGQLVCLAIITAFILVFLIREWVINQQPLLNVPDADQPANDAPAPQVEELRRPGGRRRRRHRQLPVANPDADERRVLAVQPRVRRAATENNILIQNPENDHDRPEAPRRAASLVAALQELEDTARMLGEYPPPDIEAPLTENQPLESPPLQRGVFDDVGHIQRTIEEGEHASSRWFADEAKPAENAGSSDRSSVDPAPEIHFNQPSSLQEIPEHPQQQSSTDEEEQIQAIGSAENDDSSWTPDYGTDIVPTPQTSSDASQDHDLTTIQEIPPEDTIINHQAVLDQIQSRELDTPDEDETPVAVVERGSLWTKVSRWLWHVDDYVEDEAQAGTDDQTEAVINVDAQDLFAPVAEPDVMPQQGVAAAADLPQEAPQNGQNGQNADNADAADDAEDLEGVMELLGMEGPLAGMIQNIIFSVFLITLTLSASIWCPYIWGKITLLFIAHPFSVFIKAPLFLLSRTADVIVDIGLFVFGLLGVLLNQFIKLAKIAILAVSPTWSGYIKPESLDNFSMSLSQKSGARLEKTFMRAVLGFRPDLPTFSVQAHHVLRVFTKTGEQICATLASKLACSLENASSTFTWHDAFTAPVKLGALLKELPTASAVYMRLLREWHTKFQEELRPLSFADPNEIDYSLVQWSSKEKITCIALGYALFALAGYVYLKVAPYMYGLKSDEKVTGFLADTLRQAGGVMKVIVIIGIEMIVFPLYCGTMLDFALLPLFRGATVQTRLQFFARAPLTALFIHWFIGTCYMFHFALFVSMCRKIMRKGVLYFIRDPDDPTFHPVRDVLERPVATQLGKIAYSAFVYGSLLVICLGGVVAGIARIGEILPLRWNSGDSLAIIPGDIVVFNFIIPFVLRKVDLSEKLSAAFEWWFRACAAGLRLSDFMFGIDDEMEKEAGAFLWKKYFNRLFANSEAGPLKDLKDVAKYPERLLWFETDKADEVVEDVRQVVGPDVSFKNIHEFQLDGKAQALLEFDSVATVQRVKTEINDSPQKLGHARLQAKSISEIQVDIRAPRDTKIDTSAGMYVRAPAKDSVRIPKGTKAFVQVNEKNERLNGDEDNDDGLHGKKNEKFSRIYVPNHFKARVLTFVGLVWAFVAFAGLGLSIGPLLLGRLITKRFSDPQKPINDLYSITVGMHTLGIAGYMLYVGLRKGKSAFTKIQGLQQSLPWIVAMIKRTAGILYLTMLLGVVLPLSLAFLVDLYVNIPVLSQLQLSEENLADSLDSMELKMNIMTFVSSPTINLIQSWTLGLLYLRLVLRMLRSISTRHNRPAVALRSITRRGILRPDVKLATRALVLPLCVICILLIGFPLLAARVVLLLYPHTMSNENRVAIYRYSYPIVLWVAFVFYIFLRLRQKIKYWRIKIRDEVYLVGERLHNFPVQENARKKKSKKVGKSGASGDNKGKGKERAEPPVEKSIYHGIDTRIPDTSPSTAGLDQGISPMTGPELASDQYTPASSPDIFDSAATTSTTIPEGTTSTEPRISTFDSLNQMERPENTKDSSSDSYQQQQQEPKQNQDIEQFKELTGLQDAADINDLGDLGRCLFSDDEQRRRTRDADANME